jgi:hypothetical protein
MSTSESIGIRNPSVLNPIVIPAKARIHFDPAFPLFEGDGQRQQGSRLLPG